MFKTTLPLLAALALSAPAALAQTPPTSAAAAPSAALPPAAPADASAPAGPGRRGPARSPEAAAAAQSQRLAQRLALSPDQQTRVQAILLAERQQGQAAREQLQSGGDRRAAGQALRASRAQADEQLRAVLTPAQYTQYQQMLDDRRAQARARRQGGDAD